MFATMSKGTIRRLWPHQADALGFAVDHLNRLESPCLIRMPTGTGKTGVIACLTMLSNPGSSLVLTPWAHLRDQMLADLDKRFWEKVGLTPNNLKVVSMFPSTAKAVLKDRKPQVIVATFSTLNDLRLNRKNEYDSLATLVSLVIVDEGHYEPAVEWGKSVKGLKTKTVLLTATPYRNDLKLFRITDPRRSTHHFTHRDAVCRRIIRKLSFGELASQTDIASLSSEFANTWKKAKGGAILPSRTPRAIICCAGATEIETTVAHLRSAGVRAIGIHEQFDESAASHLRKHVPDPKKTDVDVWVHQHKLTEGLDDCRFCCLALFTKIRNDRKLIQQIGRILRRGQDDRNASAMLFAPPVYGMEAEWEAYLLFETDQTLLEPQHFRDVVETLLKAQPPVEYFDGRFRRRFNPSELSQKPQVIIPPSVLVRVASRGFSLDEYIEDTTDTLNTQDAVILGPNINAPCQRSEDFALWVYASIRNSRLLHSTSLYEVNLETHCVVYTDRLVFMTDSRGNFPEGYLEDYTTGVAPEQLGRYLDETFRPTNVSVDSVIPYDTVIRGAELRGHNLLSIPASLTDRVQICRSARGSSRDEGRRYVGMNKGRVRKEISEEGRRSFELTTFVSWAKSVAEILKSNASGSALFQRFMQTCAPPAEPRPRTICIDLQRLDIALSLADGRDCQLKSSSCDIREYSTNDRVVHTCTFEVEGRDITDDASISLRIEYHPTKKRFAFKKQDGVSIHVTAQGEEGAREKSLTEFLNQRQDIILIALDGGEIVYQARNFYRIDYSYAEEALLGLIERPESVPHCKTEKGSDAQIKKLQKSGKKTFPKGSLFRFVADPPGGVDLRSPVLICDDLGTECADFVAADFDRPQLALIHAKAGGGSQMSASAFHSVVAQAMKNLVYFTRNSEVPKGAKSWNSTTMWKGTGIPRLYRAPKGLPSGQLLWKRIKSQIIGSSNPELKVILVTTGCCDLPQLYLAVKNPSMRTPETAQFLHLLDGLNGYARQLGVRVIVYDIPFQSS